MVEVQQQLCAVCVADHKSRRQFFCLCSLTGRVFLQFGSWCVQAELGPSASCCSFCRHVLVSRQSVCVRTEPSRASNEVFCKSLNGQPGRAHTHSHTRMHTSRTQCYRPLSLPPSLPTPPQISQFTELCHRTSPASPPLHHHHHLPPPPPPRLPHPALSFPADFARRFRGSRKRGVRRAATWPPPMVSVAIWPRMFEVAPAGQPLAEERRAHFSSLRAPEATHGGWLLRARSSPVSTRTEIRAGAASLIKESGEKMGSTEVTALYSAWCVRVCLRVYACVFVYRPPPPPLHPPPFYSQPIFRAWLAASDGQTPSVPPGSHPAASLGQ